jgi:protein SCO1/2
MKPRYYLFIGLVLAGVILAVAAFARPYQFQGTRIEPAFGALDASLTDQNGQAFALNDFRKPGGQGKLALVFFGYTHCPDVCPLTMAEFKQIKEQLGDKAGAVSFVFITVDPQRDSPENIQTYLRNFDETFIGLTGDEAALQPVWDHFGVYREKQELGSAAGYLMDHSSRLYLLDAEGRMVMTFSYGMQADEIAADIRHLLEDL